MNAEATGGSATRAGHRPGTGWTIGQLASRAHLSPDAIRYYERIGLLPPPPRTGGAHRRYGPDTLDRIEFIQGAQRLGLRLVDITDLLAVRDTGSCPCEPASTLLRRRLAEVDAEMALLASLRSELVRMVATIPDPDCPDPVPGTWRPRS